MKLSEGKRGTGPTEGMQNRFTTLCRGGWEDAAACSDSPVKRPLWVLYTNLTLTVKQVLRFDSPVRDIGSART